MSAYITNIPEIGSSLDIENVLRELGIDSTERSGQEIRCGCPLHNGEDRNFSINTSTQAWKCHSNPECGGGSGTNKIVILDCWRKNGDYFRDKRDSKEKIKDVATRTRGARVPNEGCSRAEHKEEQGKKNPYNNNCLVEEPISSPPSDINKFITKHGMQGQKIECSFLAVIQHGINEKLNWVLPEIEEAWNVLAKYKDGINNYIGFIVSTINNLKKKSKSNFNTKGKTKCKATATVVPLTEETKCGSYKPRFLGDALRELASQHLT